VSSIFNPSFPRGRSPAGEKSRCKCLHGRPSFSLPFLVKLCHAAPAIPLPELWAPILRNCLGEISFFSLQQNAEFCELQFDVHQLCYLVNWARTESKTESSIGSLMRAFNYSRCAVRSALANRLNPPKSRGRHLAVDAESDANILA
jgi:hypothetical protein